MTRETVISGLFAGKVRDRWPGKAASAIGKHAVAGSQAIGPLGLEGDEQADLTVHGGTEKALHHYPAEHYALWQAELGANASPCLRAGGFGENISTLGLTEADLCIGDVLRLGTATVQISQGRQPCWKLAAHTGIAQMAYLVQKTGWTGWYARVLEPGRVAVGDSMALIDRLHEGYTVARVTRARLSARVLPEEALALAGLEALNPGWRAAFQLKAEGLEEDTAGRLGG